MIERIERIERIEYTFSLTISNSEIKQTHKNNLPKQLVRSVGYQYGAEKVLLNIAMM